MASPVVGSGSELLGGSVASPDLISEAGMVGISRRPRASTDLDAILRDANGEMHGFAELVMTIKVARPLWAGVRCRDRLGVWLCRVARRSTYPVATRFDHHENAQ